MPTITASLRVTATFVNTADLVDYTREHIAREHGIDPLNVSVSLEQPDTPVKQPTNCETVDEAHAITHTMLVGLRQRTPGLDGSMHRNRIDAIKTLRAGFGFDLRTSKGIVDALCAELDRMSVE